VIRSIRVRIGLSVLMVTVALLVAQDLWTLRRFEKAGRAEVDAFLHAELSEMVLLLGTPQLDALIRTEVARRRPSEEVFFEIRRPSGEILLASENLPEGGLGRFRGREGEPSFWERTHPASEEGHRRIRVADLESQGHRFRVAQSLLVQQKRYWGFREDLLLGLAIIATLATAMAWLVATRALAPVGRIIDRARALESEPEELLPRTGKGDELDRLADVLNQLLTNLRAQVERTRRLSADASHALRTPLTAVRGNLELLAAEQPESEPIQEALQQVERLQRMVSGLLTLERVAARGFHGEREPVELDALAEGLAADFRPVAAEREIVFEVATEPAVVLGHARPLREAVANLIDNALRHTPRGGLVRVQVTRAGPRARVVVGDTGSGFDPADAERLFERFYSIGESGTGTGLGLAITRATARAHGGGAFASSSPAGSTFTIELPLSGDGSAAERPGS
jgi:signal transduction histidine kinase